MKFVPSIALVADAISAHNNANMQLHEQVTKVVNIEVAENGKKWLFLLQLPLLMIKWKLLV